MKYAFLNGTILDGTKDMKPYQATILVNNQKIEKIITEKVDLTDYKQINLQGKYIMPGLINMHVHLAGNGKPQKKQRDNTKLVKTIFSNPIGPMIAKKLVANYANLELMSGVTTIRTVGGLRDLDGQIKDEINAGKRIGPRILTSNQAISVPNGHMAGSVAVIAETPQQAIDYVNQLNDEHVDLIKLMITGGVLDAKEKGVPGQLKMDPSIVKAACTRAHELGLKVAAHVESTQGVLVALENGVDSIEHGAKPTEQIINLFKEKNAFVTCTLSPALPYALFDRSISNASEVEQYNGKVVFDGIVENAKLALENNIPVALGNDVGCPWITQYDFYRELHYFTKYVGVTNNFAIYSATLNNAILAGIGDITGSIEEGKDADMIVLKHNPLEQLRALRNVEMVLARGNLIDHPKVKRNPIIDQQLDQY